MAQSPDSSGPGILRRDRVQFSHVTQSRSCKGSIVMPQPTHISVLGGGLTGLSSAFHLSRRFPSAKITLLERSSHIGGWVHSERVEVKDDHGRTAKILLERGPRTLLPNGKATLEIVGALPHFQP